MITGFVRSFVGFPAMLITYWLGSKLIAVFDDWTMYTLARGESIATVFRKFSEVIYNGGETGQYVMPLLIMLSVWIGTKMLTIVFALRTIGLAVLMMAGPVAWMLFAVKGIGPQWVVRYFSAGFTLLLAGPLTMGFVALIMRGLGNLEVLWAPTAWPLLLALILTVFAPFAIMSMFSFAGGAAADGLGSQLGQAGRSGMNAARSGTNIARGAARSIGRRVSRGMTRAGQRPAGIAPGGTGPGKPSPAGRGGSMTRPTGRPRAGAPAQDGRPSQPSQPPTRTGTSNAQPGSPAPSPTTQGGPSQAPGPQPRSVERRSVQGTQINGDHLRNGRNR